MTKKKKFAANLRSTDYFEYRERDILALLLIIAIWAMINSLLQPAITLTTFILSFGVMAIFTTLAALLIRKCGIVFLMFVLAVLAMESLPDLSGLGAKAVMAMAISGLLFEILYLLFYAEVNVIPFDVILAVSVSLATIPLWTGLLLSTTLVRERIIDVINLMLLDFFIGLVGAMLAFLFWLHIRVNKEILKFEYAS